MINLSPVDKFSNDFDFEKRQREKQEASEKFKIFKYSEDCSFMIDNPQEVNSWEMAIHERNMLNNKERENLENELTKDMLKASQKRDQFRKYPNLQSNFVDFYEN